MLPLLYTIAGILIGVAVGYADSTSDTPYDALLQGKAGTFVLTPTGGAIFGGVMGLIVWSLAY